MSGEQTPRKIGLGIVTHLFVVINSFQESESELEAISVPIPHDSIKKKKGLSSSFKSMSVSDKGPKVSFLLGLIFTTLETSQER